MIEKYCCSTYCWNVNTKKFYTRAVVSSDVFVFLKCHFLFTGNVKCSVFRKSYREGLNYFSVQIFD